MLVLATVGAPQRRWLRRPRRRARSVGPSPATAPVAIGRSTVIDAVPLPDERAAERWLRDADREAVCAAAIVILNRVLHAHRIATADAAPRDVTRAQALVARVGYGAGEEVADGLYRAAVELPAPPEAERLGGRRAAALRPQERLGALLSGRDAALACEELTLRARADLDAGRMREAALMLRVALEAALSELAAWGEHGELSARLAELSGGRAEVAAAADRALDGALDPSEEAAVARVLGRLEAALRARTSGGIE